MASSTLPSMLHLYTKGTKAWFRDDVDMWVSATFESSDTSNGRVRMVFKDDKTLETHLFECSQAELQRHGEAILPPLRNPPKLEQTDDLTNLSVLNEPSVLHAINTRYKERHIYTYSGIVLIAVNPFDRVSLYDSDTVHRYSGANRNDLDPHLFAIAQDAYRRMIRDEVSQTIVVSGESGAGKTVSAKYIMRYFAMVNGIESESRHSQTDRAMSGVEAKILATNPIMEAFGNAKTTRNDNSSRFGKYIEIQFDRRTNIIGAKLKTYLLERSRLILQQSAERNYHIFYQLCAGLPDRERAELGVGHQHDYLYLNQGGAGKLPGVDDAEEYRVTMDALSTIGLDASLQWNILTILAALLHIGNIDITGRNDAMVYENDAALVMATQLLGIDANEFRKWIVAKQIITRTEKIVTHLNPTQAHVVKDSVTKYIYANLFDWLVNIINEHLACDDEDRVTSFIGVLDIYGFEHFQTNSFEQFCINYANEKLQQQFNKHVFKLEQEEYVREEIDWTFITFTDNQRCIELIEGKLGIMALLDEESRLPAGTDTGLLNKLYANLNVSEFGEHFKKPRFSDQSFIVAHYAHDVEYDIENFLDKNKDSVPDEQLALLKRTQFSFLRQVLETTGEIKSTRESRRLSMLARKPTLGTIFKNSLIQLMEVIGRTNVHYIRCIKPNETKKAWKFEPALVLSQLQACGVLETIRISCAGFPSRWTFRDFADRYYVLVNSRYWGPRTEKDVTRLCSKVLDQYIGDRDKYQLGRTKVFFRAGQLAYLELQRQSKFNACATLIQKNFRRYVARRRYVCLRALVLRIQCVARSRLGYRALVDRRKNGAARRIQTCWRRYVARKEYLVRIEHIRALQRAIRCRKARRALRLVREEEAATKIQSIFRGWRTRKNFQSLRNHFIHIQAYARRRLARKHYWDLRIESRTTEHFKQKAQKLENKMVDMTRAMSEAALETEAANEKTHELQQQIMQFQVELNRLQKENKTLEDRVAEKNSIIEQHVTQSVKDTETIKALREEINNIKVQGERRRDDNLLWPSLQPVSPTSSQTARRRHSWDDQGQQRLVYPQRPRSSSISVPLVSHLDEKTEELQILLRDDDALVQEMLRGLVPIQQFPLPSDDHPPLGREIVFPAQAIYMCASLMWQYGHIRGSKRLLLTLIDGIETQCQTLVDHQSVLPFAFWLVNVRELYAFVFFEEHKLSYSVESSSSSLHQLFRTVKTELTVLERNLFESWLRGVKKLLEVISDTALLNDQPGLSDKTSDMRWLMTWVRRGQLPTAHTGYTMDDLIHCMDFVWTIMTCYLFESEMKYHTLVALLTQIGISAFNRAMSDPLITTWKRGLHIQRNITRLTSWCKDHELLDGFLYTEKLMQVTQLLQVNKSSAQDIDYLLASCTELTPKQIHHVLSQYHAEAYEMPVSSQLLQYVATYIVASDDNLFLSPALADTMIQMYEVPFPRDPVPDTYLPAWLNLKQVRRIACLVQARQQDLPDGGDDHVQE